MKSGITAGGKISDSHQTIITHAIPVIKELKKEDYVDRIVIGKILNTPSRVKKLIGKNTGTSIRLTVKSRGELQEFYLIGSNLNRIEKKIEHMSKMWR